MTDHSHRPDGDGLLRALADEITAEADNISPVARTHPAGVMIEWASRLRKIVRITPSQTRDGAEGTGDFTLQTPMTNFALLRGETVAAPPKPAPDAMREAPLYTVLKKYLPQDARLDDLWQELKEHHPSREPTPDMRIAGGIAWYKAFDDAETAVDCVDACWKAMWDIAYDR